MKQTGKFWKTAEGVSIPERYVPAHEKLAERLGQKIAENALALEKKINDIRAACVAYCKEVLAHTPTTPGQKRFTFYTFDHQFRFEYEIQNEYVRIYRATKENPSSKDYELITLEMNTSTPTFTEPNSVDQTLSPLPLFNTEEEALMHPADHNTEIESVDSFFELDGPPEDTHENQDGDAGILNFKNPLLQ